MEAEHFYHCLRQFFKENTKNSWEKNELQDALREQYMKLLNSDFSAKKVITETSKRKQTSRLPLSYKFKIWVQHQQIFHRSSLQPPIFRSSARTPPIRQEPTLKLIDRALDLARLNVKAISLGWLVALLEKTSSICQIRLSRASQTIWKLNVSRHTALAIAAVALLMIPIAYFSLHQAATETSGYANVMLLQPTLANSVLAVGPNVVNVKDIASRLAVLEFHNVALAEGSKWNFHNANFDAAEFTVPLLFVPGEVDSETIVRREPTLGSSKTEAKAMLPANLQLEGGKSKSTIRANPRTAGLKVAQAVETDGSKILKLAGKPDQGIEYRTRKVASLRQEPRYGAPKTEDIDAGATISVLETKGDWLKVKTGPSGAVGYVRKEYVAPLRISQ